MPKRSAYEDEYGAAIYYGSVNLIIHILLQFTRNASWIYRHFFGGHLYFSHWITSSPSDLKILWANMSWILRDVLVYRYTGLIIKAIVIMPLLGWHSKSWQHCLRSLLRTRKWLLFPKAVWVVSVQWPSCSVVTYEGLTNFYLFNETVHVNYIFSMKMLYFWKPGKWLTYKRSIKTYMYVTLPAREALGILEYITL